jgi:hypothetical protein
VSRALFVVVALASCAPTYRVVTGKCPTTPAFAADFAVTGVLLATSAYAYNEGRTALSAAAALTGMAVALAANASECR